MRIHLYNLLRKITTLTTTIELVQYMQFIETVLLNMSTFVLYHRLKSKTPLIDTSVNETLRHFSPFRYYRLLQFVDGTFQNI